MTQNTSFRQRFWLIPLSMAFISFSILSFEIVLTRIFSVMLTYHYVFAIISMALLGLGLGAMLLKKVKRFVCGANYVAYACGIAFTIGASAIAIIKLPLFNSGDLVNIRIWIYIMLITIPFFFAGLTFAELFQKFPERSSLLYGFDLIGATLGALLTVNLLNWLNAVDAAILIVLLASLGALLLCLSEQTLRIWNITVPLGVFLLYGIILLGGFFSEVPIANDPNKDMLRRLKNPKWNAKIVETRWSAFGRTDLVRSPSTPGEMTLFIDGAAGTTMYNLDSLTSNPRRRTQFLHHFPESFPFFFLEENEKDSALIIGPGGGRDVVVALLGNVKSIIAVEVNPDLVEIMREYEDFNGGLYTQLPNVQVVVQEGRNYIRSVNKKFDLIMLALPITKSSRSVEGYALTENYLFTVDAVENYLDHLTPEGRLVIVAHGEAEIYRLLTLTLTAFEKRGIDAPEAMKHIYTLAHGVMPSIVVKRQPFDSLAAERRHELMHTLGYDRGNFFVPFSPQVRLRPLENLGIMAEWTMFDQILFDISKGKLTVDQLINSTPLDLRPVTDDSPFFYNFKPGLPQPFGLFTLLIISLIVILFIPFSTGIGKSSSDHPLLKPFFLHPRLKLFLIIFFLLGVGFMLIEISLLQKLTLYIGQPIMVLSLLLASLLLGTGLGSLCSSAINTKIYRFFAAAVLLISGMVIGFQVSFMEIFSLSLNTKLIAGILTLLLGFLLGFPFPLSIRLMKQFGVERYIHWMYGINGIASVVGSAAAMIIGILWGFSYALYLAAILYGITGLAAFLLPRASSRYRLLSASVEASDHYVTQFSPVAPGSMNSIEVIGTPLENSQTRNLRD